MIKLSNMLFVISATFIIGGLITGFGPFYIAALACLLVGTSIALDVLHDEITEMDMEFRHLKRDMYKEGFKDGMAEARTLAEMGIEDE